MITLTREEAQSVLDAVSLAMSSHNVMLTSDPPQDAWKVHGVQTRLAGAWETLRARLAQTKPEPVAWTYTDQGYEPICEKAKIQNHTFTFDEAARLQRIVWEASGTPAFSSPNGNMIRALVNLVAQEVKLKEKNHG